MKTKNVLAIFALSGLLSIVACNEKQKSNSTQNKKTIAQNVTQSKKEKKKQPTIYEFTSVDKGFSSLTSTINTVGLVKTLNGSGPYTIFAPVNLAFDKLEEGVIKKMIESKNKEQLRTILEYHIVPRIITKEDIMIAVNRGSGSVKLTTMNGILLTARIKEDQVFLVDESGNGGYVIATDTKVSNGLIHSIDAVMMPKK
ncbi:fasciclin domain-containing protein [Aquimarina sp. I32.4]|uniref:fasciclin domain-containing protein n=1 Tax=Aquimarina sp. I32.4 TaxID=2053903 RepID=UPI000CDF0E22|nr:fasciclin domain-containing protein [Aquimarina sp. I32.4]